MNLQERTLRRRLRTLPQVYDEIDRCNYGLSVAPDERGAAQWRTKLAILRRMSIDLASLQLPMEAGVGR